MEGIDVALMDEDDRLEKLDEITKEWWKKMAEYVD